MLALRIVFLLFPIGVFSLFIVLYAADGPFWDDYPIVLKFMLSYYQQSTWVDKLRVLFSQFNEHRAFSAHLFHLLQYKMFGHIDFVQAIIAGNLALFGVAGLHLYLFRHAENRYLIAAVILYLSFPLIPIVSLFVASAGTAMHFSLFFVYLALILIAQQSWKSTLFAGLVAVQALFTLGSGVILFLLLPLMLFMCRNQHRDQGLDRGFLIKQLIVIELFGVLAVAAYLIGYTSHSSGEQHLLQNLMSPLKFIADFVVLLGFGFSFATHSVAAVLGVVFLGLSIGLLLKGYHFRQPALAVFFLFLLASMAAICLGRDWRHSHALINQSRYALFSILAWAMLLAAYADLYGRSVQRSWYKMSLVCAALFSLFVASYVVNAPLVMDSCLQKKSESQRTVLNILANPLYQRGDFDNLLRWSIEQGFFDPNKLLSESPPRWLSARAACFTGITAKNTP